MYAFAASALSALLLHLAQSLIPLKIGPSWLDGHVGWHFWIVETLALTGMGLSVAWIAFARAVRVAADRRHSRWSAAVALGAVLYCCQIALLAGFWLTRNASEEPWKLLHDLFWLDAELRLPSFFSAFQLGLGAALAWRCYRSSSRRVWISVGVILGYMAVDELRSIHERIGIELKTLLGACAGEECQFTLGPMTTAYWVVIFGPLALLLGGVLFFELRALLARRDLYLLVAAAAIFLLGAVGFESWQVYGRSLDEQWFRTDIGQLVLLAEEGLEMIGVTLAVMVLKAYRPLGGLGSTARHALHARMSPTCSWRSSA